jgi:hypothetical protein
MTTVSTDWAEHRDGEDLLLCMDGTVDQVESSDSLNLVSSSSLFLTFTFNIWIFPFTFNVYGTTGPGTD